MRQALIDFKDLMIKHNVEILPTITGQLGISERGGEEYIEIDGYDFESVISGIDDLLGNKS